MAMYRNVAACTCPVVVVDIYNYAGGVAEDAGVDNQPITRADFVPAKVFRSRSMNTLTAQVQELGCCWNQTADSARWRNIKAMRACA